MLCKIGIGSSLLLLFSLSQGISSEKQVPSVLQMKIEQKNGSKKAYISLKENKKITYARQGIQLGGGYFFVCLAYAWCDKKTLQESLAVNKVGPILFWGLLSLVTTCNAIENIMTTYYKSQIQEK